MQIRGKPFTNIARKTIMKERTIIGLTHLPKLLKETNSKNLFLVTDSSYPFLNIKNVIEALPVEEKVMFSDFTPNPLQEQVNRGIELFLSMGCDAILAIGGGSCIDVAKCIKLACLDKIGRIPFIAIPTTAGTGSESTHNAVVYLNGVKQTVTDDRILPDFALLESSVLETLPIYQKKCTMMDALCQGIESWWSVNSTDESKTYSKKAVELIITHWKHYIMENDKEAAGQIMLAANYSGKAINIAQTTAAHAMSYKITSMYGLPHGHAVAVCLPEIWLFMMKHMELCIDSRGEDYLIGIFQQIAKSLGSPDALQACNFLHSMLASLDLHYPTSRNRNEELETLTRSINPIRLKNNPVSISEDVAYRLYSKILK